MRRRLPYHARLGSAKLGARDELAMSERKPSGLMPWFRVLQRAEGLVRKLVTDAKLIQTAFEPRVRCQPSLSTDEAPIAAPMVNHHFGGSNPYGDSTLSVNPAVSLKLAFEAEARFAR
jgi:hypothetical protein